MATLTTAEKRLANLGMCPGNRDLRMGDRIQNMGDDGGYYGPPGPEFDAARCLYVDGQNGLDTNDGSSWDKAYKTIQVCFTAARAALDWDVWPTYRPGIIYIAPGTYTEQLTALPWQYHVVGCGGYDQRGANGGVTVTYASGPVIGDGTDSISMLSCVFHNIVFETGHASPAVKLGTMQSSGFDHCTFYRGNTAGTYGLHVGVTKTGPKDSFVTDCLFTNGATPFTHGIYCDYSEADTYAFHNGLIARNIIAASTAGIYIDANAVASNCRIVENIIYRPVKGIDDNHGGSYCIGNKITASSDAIEHANTTTHCIGNLVINNATAAWESAHAS